jgi:hypothetical protein
LQIAKTLRSAAENKVRRFSKWSANGKINEYIDHEIEKKNVNSKLPSLNVIQQNFKARKPI